MKNDNSRYLEEACKGGKFNGEVPTKTGNKTYPNSDNRDLDKAQVGSKMGLLKGGKSYK